MEKQGYLDGAAAGQMTGAEIFAWTLAELVPSNIETLGRHGLGGRPGDRDGGYEDSDREH